jgi:hypothetical protein
VAQKIADLERKLNGMVVAGALERDAGDAIAGVLAIEKSMLDNTERFSEACKAEALSGPNSASAPTKPERRSLPARVGVAIAPAPGQ